MPRRNRNALRGGPKLTRDAQVSPTAAEFDDLDHLIMRARRNVAAKPGAAADFSVIPTGIYATAAVVDGGPSVTAAQSAVALPALHEALDAAARAALLAESGDVPRALSALRGADHAADKAFSPGSPEAAALATVLRSIAGSEETAVAEMSVRELRADLADVINAAGTRGQVTFVTSRGRRVAAVVSVTAGERVQ